MFSTVPRLAHRCYHSWDKRAEHVQRNTFGVLVRVKIEVCNRCKQRREQNEVICEPAVKPQIEQSVETPVSQAV